MKRSSNSRSPRRVVAAMVEPLEPRALMTVAAVGDLAIAPDGADVVVGTVGAADPAGALPPSAAIGVVRRLADGAVDHGFSGDGRVVVRYAEGPSAGRAVAVEADGTIVVAGDVVNARGDRDLAVARLNPDGTLDPSFGGGGRVVVPFDLGGNRDDRAAGVAILPDGSIVVAATVASDSGDDYGLARLRPDGTLDPSFGDGGRTTIDFGLAGAPDDLAAGLVAIGGGRLTVGGTAGASADGLGRFGVAIFRADGSLDPAFGSGGIATVAASEPIALHALAADPGGRLVLAGGREVRHPDPDTVDGLRVVARLGGDGTLDPSFGDGGLATDSASVPLGPWNDLAIQDDGGVLLAASLVNTIGTIRFLRVVDEPAVARLNPDGTPDPSFGEPLYEGPSVVKSIFLEFIAQPQPVGPPSTGEAVRSSAGRSLALAADGTIVVAGDGTGPQAPGGPLSAVAAGAFDLTRISPAGMVAGRSSTLFPAPADHDGDGVSDFVVFRQGVPYPDYSPPLDPTPQGYLRIDSRDGVIRTDQGLPLDAVPVAGDFDGDGIADTATYAYDPAVGYATFHIVYSTTHSPADVPFGGPDDLPAVGDYDGDGIDDIAVHGDSPDHGYSRFAVLPSGGGPAWAVAFGGLDDAPAVADYDGDGKADVAVYGYSPDNGYSRFAILPSSGGSAYPVAFGGRDDAPTLGDFDGDGKADIAVYGFSPLNGFNRFGVLYSSGRPTAAVPFGEAGDVPVGADYDGDGVTDLAVYGFSAAGDYYRFRVFPPGMYSDHPLGGDGAIPSPSSGYLTLHGLPTMSSTSSARQLAALAAFDLDAVARVAATRPRP